MTGAIPAKREGNLSAVLAIAFLRVSLRVFALAADSIGVCVMRI